MSWTTPADLRARVRRWWQRGELLRAAAGQGPDFPRRLPLRAPTAAELSDRFAEAREWIARLDSEAGPYRVVWRTVSHRTLGANTVPAEIWIDSVDAALAFIGRRREADRFAAMAADTRAHHPELAPWLLKRPLKALALADAWPRLLAVVDWLAARPRPGCYLRQVDVPGVHSKFIERHRAVLSELFDLSLPPEAVDPDAAGAAGFCRRYGFRDKPARVRFRLLDPQLAPFPTGTDQDITLTGDTFARIDLPVRRVWVTENEINFLSFPQSPGAMVIFGAGYGFDALGDAPWLRAIPIAYWGDIDTHGFAILDQLRGRFPHTVSFLMDRGTLMAHRELWVEEATPETKDLSRLTVEEAALYDDLRTGRLGPAVRLEQERIGYAWLKAHLGAATV